MPSLSGRPNVHRPWVLPAGCSYQTPQEDWFAPDWPNTCTAYDLLVSVNLAGSSVTHAVAVNDPESSTIGPGAVA
ncbi:hypothetical protein ACZ90_03165 [Streptomyces albus subsp. albus]|nr:hypothetical protein ACZ90_03165 [Streptomyces albus subsp. albus]